MIRVHIRAGEPGWAFAQWLRQSEYSEAADRAKPVTSKSITFAPLRSGSSPDRSDGEQRGGVRASSGGDRA